MRILTDVSIICLAVANLFNSAAILRLVRRIRRLESERGHS